MKKFILTVVAVILGVLLAGFILLPRIMPVDPDVAFLEKNRVVRAMLEPATFILTEKVSFVTKKQKEYECRKFYSSAFTIKSVGYVVTNNHNVEISKDVKEICYQKIREIMKENVADDVIEKLIIGLKAEYELTNAKGYSFPVKLFQAFPVNETDMAVLQVPEKETEILKNWSYVSFRTEAIDVISGKVVSDPDNLPPAILKDEPVATMGHPLDFPFTITRGMSGNNTFTSEDVKYQHVSIPLNGGNSGGAVISLLDFKIVGMATCTMKDEEEKTVQSGIISLVEMQKALKSIGLE